ncbi:MAG: hypothetical protein JWQ48_48, partial [Conexibacter sp.]|nr:hypothetical protein [Conexibacter sp.]
MHDALVSRGVIPRLTLRLRSDPGRAVRGAARWLEADARDVVVLRPSRRRSDRPSATALLPGLRRWRVLVARRRAIAVVRRALLVAATVAIVLTAIAHGGALPTAVVIAAPLAVALLGAALVLRRRPELPAVARLLDARLALHEQLGTALELETAPRGAAHPLDARVVADASQTVSSTLGGSRAVARRARGEWLALLAAAAAVVALALTSGTSHGGAAPVQHARAQAPHSSGAAAAARRRAQRPATTANGPVRPRFNPYTNGFQNAYQRALARQLAAHPELSYTSPGLRPDIAQAGAAPGRSGAVQHPQSSGSGSGTAATAPSPSAAASPASGAVTPIGRATPAGA